ncbi:fibronectin type III domain-containing protein [Thiocapsa marina]|uniref:fibronectin type III domain-containing protein n=1 Tax=Thiocapsa marina TaxID=244573 RepID=UPI0002DC43EC|nr:hypothetical protein [Thiocapsa marina]
MLLLLSSASGISAADEVRLAWNAVNDSRVANYEVHYGTASETYYAKVRVTTPSATVSGLEGGSHYFFATRACTSDGKLCSDFSNEVNVDMPAAAHSASGVVTMSGAADAPSARPTASATADNTLARTRTAIEMGEASTARSARPTRVAAENTLAATDPAIEIGEAEINQEWQRIEFQREFKDPVVVVKSLSSYDTEPAIVRVDAIDADGFSIRVQEWDSLDDAHDLETVSYLVMERGRHQLSNGAQVEAGSLITGTTQAFQRHTFTAAFEDAPVIFATVVSFNESDAVTARLHAIESDGFDVGLREQEANSQRHLPERVDFIAWEASTGVVDGMQYEVGRTGRNVDHDAHNLVYQTAFVRSPVLVADMQTTHGDDTAALRWKNLNVESVALRVQEEGSRDRETTHVLEDVGYFVADVE